MKLSRLAAFIFAGAIAVAAVGSAMARFPHGTGTFTPFVSPLKIGAGGWNTGVVIANDGTRFTRTDTYGGFKLNAATGLWEQYITKARMPASSFGYFPTTGTSQVPQGAGGIFEIDVVPSDSSKVDIIFSGKFFSSTDGGNTWVLGNLPAQPNDPDGNGRPMDANAGYRPNGKKMAVDPNNYLHVLVGTPQNGVYETLNGGTTFAAVTGLPTATATSNGNNYPGYNIAFDPSSAHNCGSGGIQTCTAYAYAYTQTAGTVNGKVWVTTNGGSTWTATTGGPSTVDRMIVAPTGGTVWATDSTAGPTAGGNVWKLVSGTWTQVAAAGNSCHSIAVDPNLATHIICVTQAGQIVTSNDTGVNWAVLGYSVAGTDVPWLPITGGINFMDVGDVVFDKNVNGLVLMGMGLGSFTSIPPLTSGSNVWTSLNAGQEQLVSVDGIAPNGVAVVGNEDRASFYLPSPNTYPSVQSDTYHASFALLVTYALDYAAGNTNFMAQLTSPSFGNAGNNSGTSSDGGQTWKPFNSFYVDGLANSAFADDGTHKVKITVPSTAGLSTWAFSTTTGSSGTMVRVVGYNGSNMSSGGYFPITVNDATHITLQGTDTTSTFNLPTATGGLGYVYVETQPLSDYNGGMVITNVANNGSGLIRVTVTNSNQSFTGQSRICISGVGGTTEANGCFAINQVFSNSNQVDLQGTAFTHAYTSGGTATYNIPNGGMIAVADANNIVLTPSNNDYPYCTTDGGQTWAQKRFPAGIAFGSSTGWSDSYFFFRRVFVADRVTPNTFYGYNVNQGIYKMTNCGTPTVVSGSTLAGGTPNTATANLFPASGAASTLKSVPGNAGHLLFTSGFIGSPTHPTATSFYRSTDGGQNWYPVANISEVGRFDCGAIAPGSDYPTCYIIGWVNNVYGTWRTTGTAAQWGSAGTTGAGLTWTQVSDYPLGSMDGPQAMIADGVTWNKWYEGFAGSGWAYGQQN